MIWTELKEVYYFLLWGSLLDSMQFIYHNFINILDTSYEHT